ncbi:VanZ family protein [Falsibacillus pallidus]|uniref:VanZ like protein n=1 Tax=Falsibacillus pallidus TaxID=493781 RepID=A0A370GQE6_9BACI|nr:VanZ family protein [Falsibacillus pallidus]RDI45540.1 VanZ like protein [Falsibacillus pallidus]
MYQISGELFIVYGFLLYLLWKFGSLALKNKRKEAIFIERESLAVLFVFCFQLLLAITLFPVSFGVDVKALSDVKKSINVIPIYSLIKKAFVTQEENHRNAIFILKYIIRNSGGSIFLFLPLGILAPILYQKYRSLKRVILTGFLLAIGIEVVQLIQILFMGGTHRFDVDDIVFNLVGAALGYWLVCAVKKYRSNNKHLKEMEN